MSAQLTPSTGIKGNNDYHGPAKASWIILAVACGAAAVPFLGFASWLIAGPLLTITVILGIVVIARGGTGHGIAILLATFVGAPVFILVAPFVSSFLGLAGTGAALQQSDQKAKANAEAQRQTPSLPITPQRDSQPSAAPPQPAPVPVSESPARAPISVEFENIKQLLQTQSPTIFTLKGRNMIAEGPRGFLTSSDKLDVAQRKLVQMENYNREKMFTIIAKQTGKTPENIASIFAEMARRSVGSSYTTPVQQP